MEIKGIRYVGPMFDMSGYGQAARGYVLALHKLGVPITINAVSFEQGKTDFGENGRILQSLVNKKIDYNIVITHLTPEHWAAFHEPYKTNIGYCVWETSKLHPDWPNYINASSEACLVSCEWSVDVYKQSGVTVPVFSVPHGIDLSEFENVSPYEVKGVKPDAYKFYAISQFTERKHPMALIKAYWAAFQGKENVALIFKTYRMGFEDKEKQVIRDTVVALKKVMPMDYYPPIYLILDPLTRNQILGLHKFGDCCVSLDRGEGFGLVPFEAGACGKPIIVTGVAGALEYAKEDNSFLVDYSFTPVFGMPWSPWYRGEQLWAEPDIFHAMQLMSYVYYNRGEAVDKGDKLKEYITNNLTWEKVGGKMVHVIKHLGE